MRGFDYVGKRVLFAALTVFVAITLNFVLFRTLSGDAVSALRCRQCTAQFKEYQRAQLGLDQSKRRTDALGERARERADPG